MLSTPEPARAIQAILRILEQFPEADFGTPGILVYPLDNIGGHEGLVIESVQRCPAPLTVEVLNRFLNSAVLPVEKERCFRLIEAVLTHPNAHPFAQEAAQNFIDYQASEGYPGAE